VTPLTSPHIASPPTDEDLVEPQVSVLRDAGYRVVAYDRRGFGRSDKPESSYSYDVLADDLQGVQDQCDLHDVTLVGFSMGGGEVARYISRFGETRPHSVVFAAAVPPYLMQSADNPDGPLTSEKAKEKRHALELDRRAFFDHFTTDFRADLKQVTVPTLVIHGDADAVVPFEASGLRTHKAVPHSTLVTVPDVPHGLNVSHTQEFNEALLVFLHA
jgi:pimeloyl-ACP methyl ester carboxylesterase